MTLVVAVAASVAGVIVVVVVVVICVVVACRWRSVVTVGKKQYDNKKPTNRAMRFASQNLVKCTNKLFSKCTTNRSNGVRGLQLTDLY